MKYKFGFIQLVSIGVVCYTLLFGLNFFFDPLAQSPQLDARENLVLAAKIDQGQLEKDPYYRAMVYPVILSLLHPQSWRPELAFILGLACHLLSGWLVFVLGRRIWQGRRAAVLAASLFLINPASLFYSLQVLDVTFATCLFLAGLSLGLGSQRLVPVLGSGLLLGLAVATRPHFLPVVLIAPVLLVVIDQRFSPRKALIWIPVLGILLLGGLLNLRHSGEFRILPWQGAYNLWAANKPGANGLYFKQAVDLSQRGDASNPARVESVYLYGQAHPGESPPYSIDAMNGYWRSQFLDHLMTSPGEVVNLWLYKAYAVVNSFEQYNNLTFSFHKERFALLRFNPMNWGVLLILGSLGFLHLWRTSPRTALGMLALILAYASMLILFYASARFRLPMVPLMAVLAGGCIGWFTGIKGDRLRLIKTALVVAIVGGITFSAFAGIRSKDTTIQDRLLMANANAELGRDNEAALWARQVLMKAPGRPEALKTYALSYFNLRLEDRPVVEEFGTWDDHAGWLRLPPTQDPATAAVFACYLWHWDRQDDALNIWRQVSSNNPDPGSLANQILWTLNVDDSELTQQGQVLRRLLDEN